MLNRSLQWRLGFQEKKEKQYRDVTRGKVDPGVPGVGMKGRACQPCHRRSSFFSSVGREYEPFVGPCFLIFKLSVLSPYVYSSDIGVYNMDSGQGSSP